MSSSFRDCFQKKLNDFDARVCNAPACLQGPSQHHGSSCRTFTIRHKTGASLELGATLAVVESPEVLVTQYYYESQHHTIETEAWVVEDVPADKAGNYIKSIMDNAAYFEEFVSEYGAESIDGLLLSIRQVASEGSIAWQALETFIAYSLATSVSSIGGDNPTPRLIEDRLQLALAKVWKDRWCSADPTKERISTSEQVPTTMVFIMLTERVVFDFMRRDDLEAVKNCLELGEHLASRLRKDLPRSHEWSSRFEESHLGAPISKRIFNRWDLDCLVGSLLSLAKKEGNFVESFGNEYPVDSKSIG